MMISSTDPLGCKKGETMPAKKWSAAQRQKFIATMAAKRNGEVKRSRQPSTINVLIDGKPVPHVLRTVRLWVRARGRTGKLNYTD